MESEITSQNEHDKGSESVYRQDATDGPVYCANCQHFRESDKMCKAGQKKTNPVTGKWRLVTLCKDKNSDADCNAYLERDWDAEKKSDFEEITGTISLIVLGLGILVAAILIGEHFNILHSR